MKLLLVGLLGANFAYSCSPASFEVVRPGSSPIEQSPRTIDSNLSTKSPVPCELVIYEDPTDKQKLSRYKQDLNLKIKNLEQVLSQNGINVSMPNSPRSAIDSLTFLLSHQKVAAPVVISKPEKSKFASWFNNHKIAHGIIGTVAGGVILGSVYYLKRA